MDYHELFAPGYNKKNDVYIPEEALLFIGGFGHYMVVDENRPHYVVGYMTNLQWATKSAPTKIGSVFANPETRILIGSFRDGIRGFDSEEYEYTLVLRNIQWADTNHTDRTLGRAIRECTLSYISAQPIMKELTL